LAAYRWELTDHLLPFFGSRRLDEITVADVDAYRTAQLARGALGPSSINRTISRLGAILDLALEHGHVAVNPVKVNPKRRKVKMRKPRRPWLEPEQVLALLDAASDLDREAKRGLRVRRPMLAAMAFAGLRVSEVCALRWRHVDLARGVLHVAEGKTDASVADVDVQPELRDVLIPWRAMTPFADRDDLVFPTGRGNAWNRHNVRQRVVLAAAERANERLLGAGREPLPEGLSPHALRRSFASWLFVEGEDVPYVQAQMRHEDPTITLAIYAQVVRNGRTSARSRRREEALREARETAPIGTRVPEGVPVGLADGLA
jgi:integrase/recombinase XerC